MHLAPSVMIKGTINSRTDRVQDFSKEFGFVCYASDLATTTVATKTLPDGF